MSNATYHESDDSTTPDLENESQSVAGTDFDAGTPVRESIATATYSPEDDKVRLYPAARLDSETYARMKAAGFIWAPRQELFVASWTPQREDLLSELAGEIGDEDTSLVDRAEERADRFGAYKENRISDAQRAQSAVSAIADHIPMGQPILVGHHSERRARKDVERMRNGLNKTVQMWKTASYWENRAAGAIRHAKYKELPGVRHRRIKTLGADLRGHERDKAQAEMFLKLWTAVGQVTDIEKQVALALRIANDGRCNLSLPRKDGDREDWTQRQNAYGALTNSAANLYAPRTVDEVVAAALDAYPRSIARSDRWIEHYANRIAYEKAMLGESGGIVASQFDFVPGGKVLVGSEWLVVLKVNKTGDTVSSLTTTPRNHYFGSTYKAEQRMTPRLRTKRSMIAASFAFRPMLHSMANRQRLSAPCATRPACIRSQMVRLFGSRGKPLLASSTTGAISRAKLLYCDAVRCSDICSPTEPWRTITLTSISREELGQMLLSANAHPVVYTYIYSPTEVTFSVAQIIAAIQHYETQSSLFNKQWAQSEAAEFIHAFKNRILEFEFQFKADEMGQLGSWSIATLDHERLRQNRLPV